MLNLDGLLKADFHGEIAVLWKAIQAAIKANIWAFRMITLLLGAIEGKVTVSRLYASSIKDSPGNWPIGLATGTRST
jgi:hypothetical protein